MRVLKCSKYRAGPHQALDGFDDRRASQIAQAGEGQAGNDRARSGAAGILAKLEGILRAAHNEIHVGKLAVEQFDEFGFAFDAKVGRGFRKASLDLAGEGTCAGTELEDIIAFGEGEVAEHGARKTRRTGGDGSDAGGIAHEVADEMPGERKIDVAVFAFGRSSTMSKKNHVFGSNHFTGNKRQLLGQIGPICNSIVGGRKGFFDAGQVVISRPDSEWEP